MNAPTKPQAEQTPAEIMSEIVGNIVKLHEAGRCRGIATVILDKNGDVHRLATFANMHDLITLLGGTVVLQDKLKSGIQPQKPRMPTKPSLQS